MLAFTKQFRTRALFISGITAVLYFSTACSDSVIICAENESCNNPPTPAPILPKTPLTYSKVESNRFDSSLYTEVSDDHVISGYWLRVTENTRSTCSIYLKPDTTDRYLSNCYELNEFIDGFAFDSTTSALSGTDVAVRERQRPNIGQKRETSTWTLHGSLEAPGHLSFHIEDYFITEIEGQDATEEHLVHDTRHFKKLYNNETIGQVRIRPLALPDDAEWSTQLKAGNFLPDLPAAIDASGLLPVSQGYNITSFAESANPGTGDWRLSFSSNLTQVLSLSGKHIFYQNEEDVRVYQGSASLSIILEDNPSSTQIAPISGNRNVSFIEWLKNDSEGILVHFLYHDTNATTWADVKFVEVEVSLPNN